MNDNADGSTDNNESTLYCPDCGGPVTKAGWQVVNRAGDTKQQYRCPSCYRRTVNPVIRSQGHKDHNKPVEGVTDEPQATGEPQDIEESREDFSTMSTLRGAPVPRV